MSSTNAFKTCDVYSFGEDREIRFHASSGGYSAIFYSICPVSGHVPFRSAWEESGILYEFDGNDMLYNPDAITTDYIISENIF